MKNQIQESNQDTKSNSQEVISRKEKGTKKTKQSSLPAIKTKEGQKPPKATTAGAKGPLKARQKPIQRKKDTQQKVMQLKTRPLTPAEITAAKNDLQNTFDSKSIRTIQRIVGAEVDGVAGNATVQAISDWQTRNYHKDDGKIDLGSLNKLIRHVLESGDSVFYRQETIHLVADYFNMDLTTGTLAVFASEKAQSSVHFEAGLRVIEVGKSFFGNSVTIQSELIKLLDSTNSSQRSARDAESSNLLTPSQVDQAITYNQGKFNRLHSINAIRHFFRLTNGGVDKNFVQQVALFQSNQALNVDGNLDLATFKQLFLSMREAKLYNVVLHLIVDYFDMPDHDNLLTLYFDLNELKVTRNARTYSTDDAPSTAVIKIKNGLFQSFEGVVHTIRHEMEHVRHAKEGTLSSRVQEVQGEALEILSQNMPQEKVINQDYTATVRGQAISTKDGLYDDLKRFWSYWQALSDTEKRNNWNLFVRVRNHVHQRVNQARSENPTLWNSTGNYDVNNWNIRLRQLDNESRP